MATEVVQINIPNLPAEIKAKLEAEATRQAGRSLASLCREILIEYVSKLDAAQAAPTNGKTRKAAVTA